MEFDELLLSAVRQSDVNLLENHLSTVVNPNLYLNRVYDGGENKKCTLLMLACLNRHQHLMHMLLHRFKPDLEVLNNVLFEDRNTSRAMLYSVSVLWMAAALNDFAMVKMLVEYGANVNHRTKTNSTPLRCACYHGNMDMARYLVEHGADVRIAKENNETNLKISIWYKHLNMVIYLVDELNCDVNESDNNKRSPLYDAVCRESIEIVEFLLKRGARNFRSTYDQMSPLMWAAEKKRIDIMEVLEPYCSLMEWIEAKELLGSAFLCYQNDDRDFEQAFEHLYRALELRLMHNIPKVLKSINNCEIFNNRQECQTLDELESLRLNIDNMYAEAFLIRERLLGPTCSQYRYSLRCRGAALADNAQYHDALDFWMYEIKLRREHSIPLYSDRLRDFVAIFSEILYESLSIPVKNLLAFLIVISDELEHNKDEFNYNLYTLLYLTTITAQVIYHHLF